MADGIYYFHIRSVDKAGNWSHTASHSGPFQIDTRPPENATDLVSSSHIPGQWSSDDTITVQWAAAEDSVSGIGGYSILWDDFPDTLPDESVDVDEKTLSTSLSAETNGDGIYFHIRSVDKAGIWVSDALHLGPFMIDTEPPPGVQGLISTSHKPDEWSAVTSVDITWTPAEDSVSGVAGYEWWYADDADILSALPNPPLHIPHLGDGVWEIYVRSLDKAGNVGDSESVTMKIDSELPTLSSIQSPSHPDDSSWYIDPEVTIEWTATDEVSGIDGYSWSWDMESGTIPDEVRAYLGQWDTGTGRFTTLPGVWYFHLRAVDKSGNWSESLHYKVRVDPSAPPAPQIGCETHRNGEWTASNDVRLSWETPASGPSGVIGYSYSLDHNPILTPDEVPDIGNGVYSDLPDGVWYFHCRARSGSEIWGPASHYEIRIDMKSPEVFILQPRSDIWHTEPIAEYSGTADDSMSGIDQNTFEYSYNNSPWVSFHSDSIENWIDRDEIPHCEEAGGDTLRVRVMDKAGNLAVSDPINIRVDRSTSPPVIVSSTHPDQDKWYTVSNPDFAWNFVDNVSGADGYSWALDHTENTIPPEIKMIEGHVTFKTDTKALADGIWYFHLRGKDIAGNWSESSHYRIKIDSTPPTAKLKISGPAVVDSDPALARAGPVEVMLQTSEAVFDPVLEYRPAPATSSVPIKLTGPQNEWKGSFNVTIHTGDGKAAFFLSASDEAGNVGNEIVSGGSFVVDTLIYADADEDTRVLCVSEPKTKISLPPGAVNQDLRIEIVKAASLSPEIIALYDFIPYNSRMRKLKNLIFRTPAEITFSPESSMGDIGLYHWDGVEWHKVQDSWMTVRVDYPGRFALMRTENMGIGITHGWAAPNPFTPNGSGDVTDRTIFHVATGDGTSDFKVKIYDLNGRLVKSLDGGRRVWDGTDEDGQMVEGGLYIYQIQSGEQFISGTVVVLN